MNWTKEYDIVVIGGGVSGLASALTGAEVGRKTLLIEKADKLGGGSSLAYGGLWFGDNHVAAAEGYEDTVDDTLTYMRFVAGDQAEDDKLSVYARRGGEALKFFDDCGLGFKVIHGLTDHYWGKGPGASKEGRSLEPQLISADELGDWSDRIFVPRDQPVSLTVEEIVAWGGITNMKGWDEAVLEERRQKRVYGRGIALVMQFANQVRKRGIDVRLGCGAERLIVENGKVTGVETEAGEFIRARDGVILATGGYDSNEKLAEHIEGMPGWRTQFPETVAGDHLTMGGEVGAQARTIHNNFAIFLGFHVPKTKPEDNILFRQASICEMLCPHTMVVNRDGQRFGDEAYFQHLVPGLREYDLAKRRHVNLPCYLIFDQQYADSFSFAYRPVGAEIPDWVARGNTPAELAGALAIDPDGLAATIERFNGFARSGVDADFGRGDAKWTLADGHDWKPARDDEAYRNPRLGTLRIAPFYGIELHPSAFVSHGLLTNPKAQVMHQRGMPIEGLYAVGNAAAHTEYGIGYQAGYSLSSGMIFGYLAARHMAGLEG